tara:strand:- start:5380 stop:5571 length:192 start_codon:yes stop_codon:yes gene_type:complete
MDDALKLVSEKIQAELAVFKDDLSLGKAKDFGDYKFSCGIVRGLMLANGFLVETAERLQNSDD